MKSKNTISAWLKTLAFLAFALALVFFPPTASHAKSAIHGDHHVASGSADSAQAGHAHDAEPAGSLSHVKCGNLSQADGDDEASGQCCSGICLSVVLAETGIVHVDQIASDLYQTLHEQTKSVEPSGFLRPPQYLI